MSFWDRLLGRVRTAAEGALEGDPAEEPGAVLRDSDTFESPTDVRDDTGPTGGTPESAEPE